MYINKGEQKEMLVLAENRLNKLLSKWRSIPLEDNFTFWEYNKNDIALLERFIKKLTANN
tara:strand:+ start:519 stop:698 length:180 start_codon:yes stop_codon:yes gene_type:complete